MKILINDFLQDSDAPSDLISPALADTYDSALPIEIDLGSSKEFDSVGIGYTDATEIELIIFNSNVDSEYENGTDVNLNNPNDDTNILNSFCPFAASKATPATIKYQCLLSGGFAEWYGKVNYTPGSPDVINFLDCDYYGYGYYNPPGTLLDQIYFEPIYYEVWDGITDPSDASNADPNYMTFADASNDGLKTITFGDGQGSFNFYYKKTAWEYAYSLGHCKFIISKSGSVYRNSISDSNLIITFNGLIGQSGGGTSLPVGSIETITFTENGLYLLQSKITARYFSISHNGSFVGRIAIGLHRNICTSPSKEPGFYTTQQSRITESGQVIPGAGGYSGRKIGVDTRYKINSDIYNDFTLAYNNQIALGFPFFINFLDESFKLPFQYFYGSLEKSDLTFQNSINRFLYSKRFDFIERF